MRSHTPLPLVALAALTAATIACAPRAGAPAATPAATPPAPAAAAAAPAMTATAVTAPGYSNETSVAIDPTAPARLLAAWQIPATVGWSHDGGASWRSAALPRVERWQLSGDPVVAFDGDGHAYALYIAFDRPEDYDTLGRAAHRNGIFLNRSDDGGATWRPEPTPVIEQPERPGIPFEDKPGFAIDEGSDPARRGAIYVAWTEFRRHESAILFARSTDGGRSFQPPVEISDRAGSPKDSVGADEGTDIAVAPDGTVYVVWSDSVGIHLDRSADGGRTFGADVLVARTPDIVFDIPGVARANGFPSLELDPRTGRLYVAWVDPRSGVPAPYVATSDDGGRSWSAPVAVATSDPRAARFFAWLTVDPRTGLVALGYYRATADRRLEYLLATSRDEGRSFAEHVWSARPFDPRGEFLGDYTGIDALDGRVAAAWTEVEVPAGAAAGPTGMRGQHHARVVVGEARVGAP